MEDERETLSEDMEHEGLEPVEPSTADAAPALRMDAVAEDEMPAPAAEEIERLRVECAELRDSYLRLRADFENSRKRMEREKSDYYRFALSGVVRELLPVLDNFDRAIASGSDRDDEIVQGVRMIHLMLGDVLERLGVRTVGNTGEPFDPNVHDAVAREDRSDVPSHSILEVLQKGYMLDDRLIRPAMVRVAVGHEEQAGPAAPDPAGDGDPETEG